jgi:hypothetical protein
MDCWVKPANDARRLISATCRQSSVVTCRAVCRIMRRLDEAAHHDRYDAFISYSHAKDEPIAAALPTLARKLGKP